MPNSNANMLLDLRCRVLHQCEDYQLFTAINDSTTIADATNHLTGDKALSWAKAGTHVNSGVSANIRVRNIDDRTFYTSSDYVTLGLYLSTIADVSSVILRLGTDASNYSQWSWADTELQTGWNLLFDKIGEVDSVTGSGWQQNNVSYMAVIVVFDAAGDTLAGILLDHVSLQSAEIVLAQLVSNIVLAAGTNVIGGVTIADGSDTTQGAIADVVVAAGAVGSVAAKLRRLTTDLNDVLIAIQVLDDWDATHGSVAVADGPQIMIEATEFTGSEFPRSVNDGDAARPVGSLNRVQYVMLTSPNGSQSPHNLINNVIEVAETANEAQSYVSPTTLHDAVILDDDPTSDVSSPQAVGQFSSKTLFVSITKTLAPTNVSLWLEFSPDGTNWYGQNSATEGVRMIDSNGNSVTQILYTASGDDVIEVPGWALHMRSNLTATGTDAANYFTCTVVLGVHGR